MILQMIFALIAGALFSAGLIVSQMVNPAKVIGFLDITGHWDPSLAFVMGGALMVTIPGFWFLKKKEKPLAEARFHWPSAKHLDARLLLGAAIFGVGWGLSGFCPGPALTALVSGYTPVLLFVLSMFAGMYLSSKVPTKTEK